MPLRAQLGEMASEPRRSGSESLQLPPGPSSVALARRHVRDACKARGRRELVDEACLVASELVANAVVHGHGGCELRLAFHEDALRIEVLDAGEGRPEPCPPSTVDEHGRGLRIVAALSASWGVEAAGGTGKLVWAELVSPTAP